MVPAGRCVSNGSATKWRIRPCVPKRHVSSAENTRAGSSQVMRNSQDGAWRESNRRIFGLKTAKTKTFSQRFLPQPGCSRHLFLITLQIQNINTKYDQLINEGVLLQRIQYKYIWVIFSAVLWLIHYSSVTYCKVLYISPRFYLDFRFSTRQLFIIISISFNAFISSVSNLIFWCWYCSIFIK